MQDIGVLLERTKENNDCSVLCALLILLGEQEEKEDVCVLQPESQQ